MMLSALAVLSAGIAGSSAAAASPFPLGIPTLDTPSAELRASDVLGLPAHHPWDHTSRVDVLGRMRRNGQQNDIDQLNDSLDTEAQALEETKGTQAEAVENIVEEKNRLQQVHSQESSQKAIYNAAASVNNKLTLAEQGWEKSLHASAGVQSFLSSTDNNEIRVLDRGSDELARAQEELNQIEDATLKTVDRLTTECHDKEMAWNKASTTAVNQMTHNLASIFSRISNMDNKYHECNEKILELIGTLEREKQHVILAPDDDEEAATGGLLQTGEKVTPSLLEMRVKVATQGPVKPPTESMLELTWQRLHVLKDLMEHKLGKSIEDFEQKFNDA